MLKGSSPGSTRKRVYDELVRTRGFALIDGGLATELERRGCSLDPLLWSAALITSSPETIRAVHESYLDSGADIIIAATYQASFEGFARSGIDAASAERVMRRAVGLAREAVANRGRSGTSPLVAASIGPYGAMLANGAEYTGAYGVGEEVLMNFHRDRLAILGDSGADLLAVETIPSLKEAAALASLLDERAGLDAWVSFSCRDGARLCDGTPIESAARMFSDVSRVAALGVNCTRPQFVASLVERLRTAVPEKDLVAYPNLGEVYDPGSGTWTAGTPSPPFEVLAEQWYRAGARLIGGCCRTTPRNIAATGQALDRLVAESRDDFENGGTHR
jgi:homocysteine S-methyltransferase